MSAHANCTHPATKSARAACRRSARNFPGVTVKDVKVETPEPTSLAFKWEPGTSQGVFGEGDEWTNLGGQPVTRENWKTYRDLVVEITITTHGVHGDHFIIGKVVAWGEKNFRYVSQTGTSNTVAAERVRHAFVA